MRSFLREMLAAIKEGPRLYFSPALAAIKAIRKAARQ